MIRSVGWILCSVLVVSAAVVHGAATHRWSALAPDPARAAAAHAHAVALFEYAAKEIPSELPVKERSTVSCRQYTAPGGRPPVVISFTSGPPGAVSTHTPDVCYPGSGFAVVKPPRTETLDLPNGGRATYLVAEFERKTATTVERQRVRWSWTADGTWQVPDRPRFAFLNQPELFKMYVVTALPPGGAGSDADPPAVREFVAAAFAQYADILSGTSR
jgi:hypothetical protein